MYNASVKYNGQQPARQKAFEINYDKRHMVLDGENFLWDLVEIKPGYFHIIKDDRSYRAEVLGIDNGSKSFLLKINNEKFAVGVKDKFDLLLDKLGMGQLAAARINDVKAPMPGLILKIEIEEGSTVKKGDPIMILEAMKMENILKSPGDGVVSSIKVKIGDSVDKGQVLIAF